MWSYTNIVVLCLLIASRSQTIYGAVPQFLLSGSQPIPVDESTPPGTSVYTVLATDLDNGNLTYDIVSQSPSVKFQLNAAILSTNAALDYENETSYVIEIRAVTDSTTDTSTATLTVNIADINDETPVITGNFTGNVDEEVPVGTVAAGPFTVTDADDGDAFSYTLSGSTKFQIDSSTREIKTAEVIDYEDGTTSFSMTLTVSDSASTPHSASQAITVTLNNVNDNTPTFSSTAYFFSVAENSSQATSVAQLTATDGDVGDTITVAIQSGDDAFPKFAIDNQLVETTSNAIDYDSLTAQNFMYTLVVSATDGTNIGTTTVYVSITGINEHAPVFGTFTPAYTSATTPYLIFENSEIGTTIVTVAASDNDAGTDGEITYSLGQITSSGGGATTGLFHLDQVTGDLTITSNNLDRDTATGGVEYYDVLIRAVDKGSPSQSVQRTVRVGLTDYNDNAPTFSSSIYTLTIAETTSTGSVFTVIGSDHDETSTLTYSLLATSIPSSYSAHFELDTTITNQVNLKAAINLDPADSHDSSYSLVITVTDGGTPELTGTTTLAVTVTSVNEDSPTFGSTTASTSISETAAVDSQVFKMDASDNDGGSDGTITYSIVGGNTNNKFNIDSSQGAVKVASSLDFETTEQYVLLIEAKDGGSSPLSSTGTLTINITDVSDELPSCTTNAFAVTITEPGTVGTPDIVTLSCNDDDAVDTLVYSISSGNAAGVFSISNTGSITLANNVDYDSSTQSYALTVQVTDGTNTLEIPVNVQVDPLNEDTPAFGADLDISFAENTPISTTIATHVATDDDYSPHDIQEYQISSVTNSGGNLFNIDKTSGVIKLAQPFDYESLATKSYIITVLAIDGGSLTGTGSVTVTVTDVNDVSPSCSPASHVISVAENTAINTDIIGDFSCSDADSMTLTYAITSQSPSAVFSVDTTGTPKLVLSSLLDYETNSAYEIVVSVSDGSFTTSVNIDVSITDINDGGPSFALAAYTTSVAENVAVGTSVIQMTATDPDSSTSSFGNLLYSFISGNGDNKFLINPSSGFVSTAGVLNAETTNSYLLVVQAIEEAGTNSATAILNVTVSSVNDNSPTCTSGLTFSVSFTEEGTTGDTVHTLVCTDADGDALTYTMSTGDATFFVMNANVLQLNAPVDYDTVVSDQFAIVIQVSDGSNTVDVTGSVTVLAANEHSPAFPSATVNVSVSEAVSPGTLISTNAVTASDADKDETITYSFITAAGDFTIDQSTGHILVAGTLDRETTDSYTITIQGSDGTSNAQYILYLVVTDENDNSPVFNPSTYSVSLSESAMIGTAVVTVTATDADDPATNDYGTVQYSIIGGNIGSLFTIGTSTGSITTAGSPNYETTTTYTLIVQAIDSNSAPGALSSTAVVTVNIDPVNDADPAFSSSTYSVSIPEDTRIGQSILKVSATDADSGNDGVITYSMVTNTLFYLDTGNGDISVRASLDFEASDSHTFEVVATDSGTSPRSSTTNVTIFVTDVNDNSPICSPNLQTVSFAENTALGTNLATLTCNDADSGVNDDLTFSIQSVTPTANIFEVTTAGLVNLINTQFNYESQISYSILIEVSDGGTSTLSTTTTVRVDVTDINEASPSFITTTFTFSISETTAVGTSVFVVSATDTDTANTITYSFNPTSSVFDIDSATGIIYTIASIDYDTLPTPQEYELTVFATDDGTGSRSVTQTVTATILDNNDGTPYFSPAVYSAVLAENAAQGTTVVTVTATDIDDASVTYSLANNFGILRIETSGDLILDTASQNYETTKSYLVVVYAVDGNMNTGTATVHIEVTGVNEHDPSFTPPSSALNLTENLGIGTTIVTVVANDSDDGVDGMLTYSLSSIPVGYEGDFAINPSTGEITLAGTIDRESVSNPLVIKALATDGGTSARSAEFTLTLTITDENDNRPSCSPSLYSVSVAENIAVSTSIAQLTCSDSDTDAPNNELTYSITFGNTGSHFEIDSITGEIRTSGTASLDREMLDNYQLLVEVADNAATKLSTTTTLTVTVTDVNDNTPAFAQTSYTFSQSEDVPIGTTVGTVVATDMDISDAGTVVYSIFSGNTDSNLAIDSNTGDIRLIAALDYERETQYNLIVYAIDKEATFRTGSTTVTFMITDTNDVKPNCTDAVQTVQFAEDTLTATVTIATVTCTDTDTGAGGTVVYTISTVDGVATTTPFSIDSNTGVITLANNLDYESDTLKQIVVFGIDGGSPALTGTTTINVAVTDVNEVGPVFQNTPYTVSLSENTPIGQSVYIIAATDADTSDTITYSFDPTSSVFEIDSSTGEVYLRGNLDFEGTPNYTLTVVATDDGTSPSSRSSTETITITITNSNDGTPIFSPAVYVGSVSENDNVGTTVTTVTATDIDGTTPTYSIISGNAANVFRIEASGAIAIDSVTNLDYDSGTQSYTLVVEASDGTNTGTATVAIAVTNYNDFSPVLMPSGSTETVAEDSPVGTAVVTVVATDADFGTDGNISYSITSGNTAGKFSINPSTGAVTLAATLDMESVTTYTLNIDATDAGTSPGALSAQYSLTVTVADVNDVTPVCTSSLYSVTLAENSVAGTSVAQLTCSDGDVSPPNNNISQYFIYSGNTGGSFTISTTGEVTVVNSPDRESLDSFVLVIHVIDGGTPALTFTTTLAILITDLNDNSPSFSANPYGFNSDEDTSVGDVIGIVMATDADSGSAGAISYTLSSGNVDSKFEIDSSTGELKLSSSLDFETATNNPYVLEILGADNDGTSPLTATTTVSVTINDKNDNTPACTPTVQAVEFAEDTAGSTTIASITCTDADSAPNSGLLYEIVSVNGAVSTLFEIDGSGVLTTAAMTTFDFETTSSYNALIRTKDSGTPSLSFTSTVNVVITDVNEAAPVFQSTPYTTNVAETTAVGSSVYVVTAIDNDSANTVTYTVNPSNTYFEIDPSTGIVRTIAAIDYDTITPKNISVTLVATDNGLPSQSVTETLVVTITDANDEAPMFNPAFYSVSVAENETIGTTIVSLTATDVDDVSLTYSIASGNVGNVFRVDAALGALILDDITNFDYDSATKSYTLVVRAVDAASNTASTTVVIEVTSINDNPPHLAILSSTENLAENTAVGTTVIDIDATDADHGNDGVITYSIASVTNNGTGKFSVDPTTGIVTISGNIDRETATSYVLNIEAADGGTVAQTATYTLTVDIADENDNTPSCTQTIYSASVSESSAVSMSVAQLTCSDSDSTPPNNDITSYSVKSGNIGNAFTVSVSGEITVNAMLDRETLDNYQLVLEVADSGATPLTTTTTLTIIITDENDNIASFATDPYNFNQLESISVGTVVGSVSATDADAENNGAVIYTIASGDVDNKFQIDSSTGDITVKAELDFETASVNPYTLVINALDGSGSPQTATTSVIVAFTDVNDNAPICTPLLQTVSFAEDTTTPTTLANLFCNDSDTGSNAALSYTITQVNGIGTTTLFAVDTSGALRLTNSLNYESETLHGIIVEVADGGTPSLTATVTVNVQVTDINDNIPVFSGLPYNKNVNETTSVGTSVFKVTAADADTADTITFSVNPVSTNFDIDPSTGDIFLKVAVDFEAIPTQYEVIVVATDDGTNPGANSASATVTLDIINFNDGIPEFNPGFYAVSVRENATAATSILTVTISDIDDTVFTFNIISGNTGNIFGIAGTTTNAVISVDDPTNLDFETTQAYTLVIRVTDGGGNTGSATVEISITNYNEHVPSLVASSSTPSIAENSGTGTSVVQVNATDADSGTDGDISYIIISGSNGKFAIDPSSGLLTVSGTLDKETLDSYTVVIHAVDAGVYPGALTATYSAVVTITDVNDFSPVCSSSLYSATLAEDSPIGTTVGQLTCTDADSDSPNKDINTYMITSGNTGGEYSISNTGEITTTVTFDRENTDSYQLVILVTDMGTTPSALSTTTTMTVSISDVNDNDPVFTQTVYNINIDESTAIHTSIGKVGATDADIDLAGSVLYSIASGNTAGKFALDRTTGDITLVGELDYEATTTTPYILIVHTIDREAIFRTGTATVSVTINDINDNEPTCTASLYTGTVAEDATISTSVATVACTDIDTVGNTLTYSILSNSPEFIIATATSGEITTASSLDYESATSHDLTVQVTDGVFNVNVSVQITVTNINDVAPVFTPAGPYTASIDENVSIGTIVYDVNATDADATGTMFVFSITSGNGNGKFTIGTSSGIIQVQQTIDRDDPLITSYTLGIEVADQTSAGALTASTSIVISITDINDNYPSCDSAEYFVTLLEDTTIANVITPTCTDLDVVASPSLLYTITAGNTEGKFQIGTGTGILSRIGALDYETTTSYTLTVTVDDQGTPALVTTVVMTIYVDPVNEHTPVFQGKPYDTDIDENVANGYIVLTVSATDSDTGSTHGTVRYSLTNGNSAGHFSLNPTTGVLTVAANLDRETTPSYTLTVAAMDMIAGDTDAKTVTDTFSITISDVNDNYPQINPPSYTASLNEHVSGTLTPVLQITATDNDEGNAGTAGLDYSITAGNTLNVFQMNGNTLELIGNIDANTQSIYTLTVKVADQGTPVLSAFTSVIVQVVATNDHAPTFTTSGDTVTISESETIGNSIYQAAASDSDTGMFAILRYYMRAGVTANSEEFIVDKFDGTVRVATQLDYDTAPTTYMLRIEVEDTENSEANTQTATTTLTVSLTDFNDETPTCTSNTFTGNIDENSSTGTSVVQVIATDSDSGLNGQITYSIVGGSGSSSFGIDSTTGDVSTIAAIDYETVSLFDLEIEVKDGGTPTLSSSCLVRITVIDLNDNTPVLLSSSFAITVPENIPINTIIDTVQATDADSTANNNNVIIFSFSVASAFFSIGSSTGILTTSALLDRESLSSHTLVIYAADQGTLSQNTATTTYTIVLSDFNDNAPIVSNAPYDTTVSEDSAVNTVVHSLNVTDVDEGENAVLNYTITNGNTDNDFRIDSGSGLLQVFNSLDRERTPLYNLEVTVTDGGTPQQSVVLTATVSIGDVNDNSPVFQPDPTTTYSFSVEENVPSGTVVNSVSASDADTGTNAIVTYVVVNYITGDNTHFSLNTATGEITTAGNLDRETQDTYVFVVRAMDAGSSTLTATATVSITIIDTNDNIPNFGSSLYTATVIENSAVDTSILSVVFSDIDILVNDDIILSIDTSTTEGTRANTYIYPNSTTAVLYVQQVMDRETDEFFNFTLIATDQGIPPLSFSTSVVITVGDANDNAPIFSPTFYNSEIAYNDDCQVTVTTITATDADIGVNAVIEYYTTLNNNPHLFTLSSTTGVVSMVANAAANTGYLMYAAARDSGSPQQNSSTGATIRIDTYNPSEVILNYYMNTDVASYLAIETAFLTQLTTVYQTTYPTAQAKRWCVVAVSTTSSVVRIYVIKDDTADEESETANAKNFLTADEAYTITAADDAGTPASAITGISWTQFAITRVEKYSDPDSDSKPWIETAAGIAVLSVAAVIGVLLIGSLVAYIIWYCRKPGSTPPRNRVEVADDDGGDTVAKNQFSSKNNTVMTANDTMNLSYDKKNLPPAVVALPMPSATKRVPLQPGNKSFDKPKDVNLYTTPFPEPIFEKKPEKLRRSSPVPTETVYSPAPRYRSDSPFLHTEINYPVKRLPPTHRPPVQRPPRLEDSVSTVPDSKSNADEGEILKPKRHFDGRAVDPVTGRVYEYNTKTNERQWVTSADGSPYKLTRDEI